MTSLGANQVANGGKVHTIAETKSSLLPPAVSAQKKQ